MYFSIGVIYNRTCQRTPRNLIGRLLLPRPESPPTSIGDGPEDLHPQRSDGPHRLDQDPLAHPPHRTNRNGTGSPRIHEEEPAPNLQTPLQRRRSRWSPIHARFSRSSIGVQACI